MTNPIQKSSLLAAGFQFPGHTEFLEYLARDVATPPSLVRGAVMMLAGPGIRTVPVTVHQSVIDAARSLTSEKIVRKKVASKAAVTLATRRLRAECKS